MIYIDCLPKPICLPLQIGERVEEMIARLTRSYPYVTEMEVSIWGKITNDEHIIAFGDRVEFTRALEANPKQVRAHKVDNKPRKGWVARVSKFTLSQLKAEAGKVLTVLCALMLCGSPMAQESQNSSELGLSLSTDLLSEIRFLNKAEEIANTALGFLGVPYKFGGNTPEQGFDCSGLVRYVFKQVLGKELPRTAKAQAYEGASVAFADLQIGDLVFFNTRRAAFSHVGIYLGENRFLHAPTSKGSVNIENIEFAYWQKRFNGARRLID